MVAGLRARSVLLVALVVSGWFAWPLLTTNVLPLHDLPNQAHVATASKDKTVKVWDLARAVLLHDLTAHTNDVWCVAYSPDGKLLASGSKDGTMKLWDMDTFKIRATIRFQELPFQVLEFEESTRTAADAEAIAGITLRFVPALATVQFILSPVLGSDRSRVCSLNTTSEPAS